MGTLDLDLFGQRLVGGRAVEVGGIKGIERGRFVLKAFYSYPYTLATPQRVEEGTVRLLKKVYVKGEVASVHPTGPVNLRLPSPVVRKGSRYHRERRRLLRRAEERLEVVEGGFEDFYGLYAKTAEFHGRKPIPLKGLRRVYGLVGVDKVFVGDGVRVVGAIMSLRLEDRYLLWQMGWDRRYNFLPTFLLHLAIQTGFSLGYDSVDLGISPTPKSLKLKTEMGGDPDRYVYVLRWNRLRPL